MKISVIGYSGAGKSTLAKTLGQKYKCPVLYLDSIHWLPGWKEQDRQKEREIAEKFMENSSWVIDGNYSSILSGRRMEEADKIIFLNFSRGICLYQALRRYAAFRGKTRDSIAEGCPEKFDWEFFCWILGKGRTKDRKQWYREIKEAYPEKIRICKNRRQVKKILETL